MAPHSPLRNILDQYAEAWVQDARRLRTTGEEKGCEKCLVAAEVYEECAAQLQDVLSKVPAIDA